MGYELGAVIDAMRTAAQTLKTGDVRTQLHALQAAQDAIDAQKAVLLAELDASKDFELDGASTLNAWVRNQLRMNAGQATALVRSVATLRDLPLLADAALSGQVSAAHVRVFVYGLAHVGLEPMRQFEDVLVQVAKDCEPGELFEAVKHLKDKVHPEDLDDAWERGMDREDFAVNAVPDGWHVSGFLNTVTGAKLKAVLDSVSAPRDKDDDRTGSHRRVQGLDDLLSSILDNGLPSDKGVRPHLSVFVDADTLEAAAQHVKATTEKPYLIPDPMPVTEPARLAGHGTIGPNLLMYFLCVSDFTAFLMKQGGGHRQAEILNAGCRNHEPSAARQAPRAKPGSDGVAGAASAASRAPHTHLQIHHTIWWSHGGPTDLDLLIGLCVRNGPPQRAHSGGGHTLLHRGRLHITGNAVNGYSAAATPPFAAAPFSPTATAGPSVADDEATTAKPPDPRSGGPPARPAVVGEHRRA